MDEAVSADVNADVLDAVHEHEVAKAQAAAGDATAAAELAAGVVRQADTQAAVHVLNEPGAVEAARRGPAPDVRPAQLAAGEHNRANAALTVPGTGDRAGARLRARVTLHPCASPGPRLRTRVRSPR